MTLMLQYNDMFFTCHSVYKTHIIMAAKLTHHGGQIIYVIYIYIYIYILWCNICMSPLQTLEISIPIELQGNGIIICLL